MKYSDLHHLLLVFIFALFPSILTAQGMTPESIYPVIKNLLPSDPHLKQLQGDVEFYYQQNTAGKPLPTLNVYTYKTVDGDSVFSLSSRFNLPYETLATLNHLQRNNSLEEGTWLLIPSIPGIFLPETPTGDLEYFLISLRSSNTNGTVYRVLSNDGWEDFLFFPNERFHSIERAYFLGILFQNPLPAARLSSNFGWRDSPFTGEQHFHNGVDLAAPLGTEVHAAREGKVISTGADDIFGNFIALAHEGGYVTFYGHLEKIFVELNQMVASTMIIGKVGNTGLSTGPHLHFELRSPNGTLDPESFLYGMGD